jgi:hypothetical protein
MTLHCGLLGYDTMQSGKREPTERAVADLEEEEVHDLTAN